MNLGSVTINWFDLVVVAVVVTGVIQGRRRGMSEELLNVLQWLTIVVVSALYYRPLGRMLAQSINFSLLFAYLSAYLLLAILIKTVFSWLRKSVGEKLVGSDVFGNAEYYLGMGAGVVRSLCVLLVILALLNARYVAPEKLAAHAKMQKDNFGDISFPTIATVQRDVFKGSLSGRAIRTHLGDQLIVQTPPDEYARNRESLRSQRNRELDEVFNSKR